MMPVDLDISLRINLEIEMTMPGNLRKHMIEKRNSRPNVALACAVNIQADFDIRFLRLPGLRCRSWSHRLVSNALSRACRNLLFSSGVPIETLRQFSSSGYALISRTSTPWT